MGCCWPARSWARPKPSRAPTGRAPRHGQPDDDQLRGPVGHEPAGAGAGYGHYHAHQCCAVRSGGRLTHPPRPAGLGATFSPAGPVAGCPPLTATAASPVFATGAGFDNTVESVVGQAGGQVLAGGIFTLKATSAGGLPPAYGERCGSARTGRVQRRHRGSIRSTTPEEHGGSTVSRNEQGCLRKGTDGCGGPAAPSPKRGMRSVCGAVQRAQPLSLPSRGAAWAIAQRPEKSPGRRSAAAPPAGEPLFAGRQSGLPLL